MDADVFISLTHFKGHESTGFGGALMNIGMDCGSRAGKMEQHAAGKPALLLSLIHIYFKFFGIYRIVLGAIVLAVAAITACLLYTSSTISRRNVEKPKVYFTGKGQHHV